MSEKRCAGKDVKFSKMYKEYKDMSEKYNGKEISEDERLREISFIKYELEQIEDAHLVKGEEAKLQERYRYLSNLNEIESGIGEIYSMMGSSDTGVENVSQMLGRSSRILGKISEYDDGLKNLASQISEIDELIMDFNRDLQAYASDIENTGEEFENVEQRLDLVRGIKAKYGATTEQVESYAKNLTKKLEKYEAYGEYKANLEKKINLYKENYQNLQNRYQKSEKSVLRNLKRKLPMHL